MTEKLLQVSGMSAADFQKQITVLYDKLNELTKIVKPKDECILLTPKDVVDWLKISKATLDNWSKEGLLNRIKIGNRAYYKKEEIMRALDGTNNDYRLNQ